MGDGERGERQSETEKGREVERGEKERRGRKGREGMKEKGTEGRETDIAFSIFK